MQGEKHGSERMLDNSDCVTSIELCAGYAGIQLGLRRCFSSLRTIAYSEIEEFACSVLASRMEGGQIDVAPIWSNLKTFPFGKFHGLVDIISGGYPCQGFSAAGKRLGKKDPRHLWPWIADGIQLCQPRLCLFENVEGHITLGLSTVVSDLEELGYAVSWGIFSAAEVGAPHQRKRVFILGMRKDISDQDLLRLKNSWTEQEEGKNVADCIREGLEGCSRNEQDGRESGRINKDQNRSTCPSSICIWPSKPGIRQFWWEPPRTVGKNVADSPCKLLDRSRTARKIRRSESSNDGQHRSGEFESEMGGSFDGSSRRLGDAELYVSLNNRQDELRILGNGVVPATAEKAFRTLFKEVMKKAGLREFNP